MLDTIYKNKIRPVSISIIRRNNEILAYKRKDDISNNEFYRLIGGCVEFNETSTSALKREFLEETSLELSNINHLSTFESIFTFNGQEMHEIIFLFECNFINKEIYQQDIVIGLEGDRRFEGLWINKNDFISNKKKLVPEEIIDFL